MKCFLLYNCSVQNKASKYIFEFRYLPQLTPCMLNYNIFFGKYLFPTILGWNILILTNFHVGEMFAINHKT